MSTITYKNECSVTYVDHMGDDNRLAMAAWAIDEVREGLERIQAKPNDVPFLINYLLKHRHGTPFEHGAIQFIVHAPIFVWREWHRHRIGFSYNEESGRYKTLRPIFYLPPRNRPMMKVEDWKAGRPKFTECENDGTYNILCANLIHIYENAYGAYLNNLDLGIDPGLARDCLPVGIFSTCWVTANPRSIMHFLSLRTHEPEAKFISYPLYEIENAARKVETLFAERWPITYKAFVDNGRVAP